MIVLSLVLVVASAATLGWGIATASQPLVWASLLAGLAAAALVAWSVLRRRRQPAADETAPPSPSTGSHRARSPAGHPPTDRWPWSADPGTASDRPRAGWTGAVGPAVPGEPPREPAEQPAASADLPAPTDGDEAAAILDAAPDRPLGEPFPDPAGATAAPESAPPGPLGGDPPVEDVPVRDALRVAQLADAVLVIDGHPRYHLAGCPTLADADADPTELAVSLARRAGFTPCAVCAPDRTLLARMHGQTPGRQAQPD